MKIIMVVLGVIIAVTILRSSEMAVGPASTKGGNAMPSPRYTWTQVAPPGSGTHQHEWKPGTYPSAVVPVKGWNDELWMIGQNKAWNSKDGIRWIDYDKDDWGERISVEQIFFKDRLWISGGMEYKTNVFLNEIWSSADGKNWELVVKHADWSPRKNHALVVFNNRLWLFGGETSVDEEKAPNKFTNDVWSSSDGTTWTKVLEEAPWQVRGNPRLMVFKDKLWLVGGQGKSDIWNTSDGKVWKKITDSSPWKDRYDYGIAVFDNFIWVFGGRQVNPLNAYNDVWFSPNGSDWIQQTSEAPWTRRSGGFSIVLRDRLFLYGGKHTGHEDGFSGDIWTLEKN